MREILFRGKRTDNGKWVEGWYEMYPFGRCPVKTSIIPSEEAKDGHYEHVQVDPPTVGQYTGLTDKNGKKIFECDVVERVGKKCIVKWSEEDAKFIIIGAMTRLDFSLCFAEHLEVIGNIHDNPELLENP